MVEPSYSVVSPQPPFVGVDGKELLLAIKKRFDVSFHPAFLLAHLLDLRFLYKDETNGRYKPDYSSASKEDIDDAIKLAVRLTDANAEVELRRWLLHGHADEGCASLRGTLNSSENGQAKMTSVVNVRVMWEGTLHENYPQLARIASRLFLLHATSCSTERLWSLLRWVYRDNRSRLGFEKARKMALLAMFRRRNHQAKDDDIYDDDLLLEWFLDEEEEEGEEIMEIELIDDLIE